MSKISIVSFLFLLCVISSSLRVYSIVPNGDDRKSYIVYMGEKPKGVFPTSSLHKNMLDSVLGSGSSKSLLHSYKNFNGFVVKLTEKEMQRLTGMKGVVSVFPNEEKFLHTTRSWDFMGFTQKVKRSTTESDIIIGVFDSGIWPESSSFDGTEYGPPPAKWKGTCDISLNFTCNNKIIGAKYYRSLGFTDNDGELQSPRDNNGHGTHTASTAAGGFVSSANMVGLGDGTARGGAPSARIAVYKICWSTGGCQDADTLAAFDDAIDDGVDIISLSVGGSVALDYFRDSIAIGSFHAMKNGILTVNSAGNSGPNYRTTVSNAPWLLSVAAGTIDRAFLTNVQLGNNAVYKGIGINTFDLQDTMYPLIYGGDAPNSIGGFTSAESMFCKENTLDANLVTGKIVLCEGLADQGVGPFSAGATGYVTTYSSYEDTSYVSALLPASKLDVLEGSDVATYIGFSSNPTATIYKSQELTDTNAPYVVSFSSRGPNNITFDLLKPDITAPGVHILAAWPPIAPVAGVKGDDRVVQFNFDSGTSMACPHVTGVSAYIKSFLPALSPAALKSAIMTTALPMDSRKNTQSEFAYGAGHLNPLGVLDPGLVYDANVLDYVNFLCGQPGYTTELVRLITQDDTSCSSTSSSARDLNLPSFALGVNPFVTFSATFTRTVTHVGPSVSTYSAIVQSTQAVSVEVVPSILSFSSVGEKLSFVVTVQGKIGLNVESASLIWDDGLHKVRSPIVVYPV